MPRYYFHLLTDRGLDKDEFGVDLRDGDAVRSEALRTVAGFLEDAARTGDDIAGNGFEVHDEEGLCLYRFRFDFAF